MVKLFKRTFLLLTRSQNDILSAASIIMGAVFLSRVLGLVRDRMLAARFTPHELGVYYAAFRLPNMIFELLVMGAVATAFIPVFTAYIDIKGRDEAFKIASSVINIGLILFAIASVPIFVFTKEISYLLAPGFSESEIEIMASFTRIMIFFQVFPLIIGNFFTGMLQSFRNFIIPSLAPVAYNLGIIFAIFTLSTSFGLYAPVIGVVLGSFLFLVMQIPSVLALGFRHSLSLSIKDPGTREVGRLMLPRTLGLAISQIDTTVDLVLASLLGAGAVTIFNFAQHLAQLPIGLFGASIAQATLPALASKYAKRTLSEYKKIFISSFHQILFLVIPVSAILIVLRIPAVRLVFGASNLFDWESTVTTGKTLAIFGISLFAQALIHLLYRAFYALHDSKTPVVVGACSVAINTTLSIIFILYMQLGVWSLALSAAIASMFNMTFLIFFLDRKVGFFDRYQIFVPTLKMCLAGAVSGVALYIPIKLLDQLVFDTTRTINLLILTGISTFAGISVYLFLAWFLEIPQIGTVFKIFKRARELRRGVIIDTTQEVVNVQETEI